jgi:hypothetical protein
MPNDEYRMMNTDQGPVEVWLPQSNLRAFCIEVHSDETTLDEEG